MAPLDLTSGSLWSQNNGPRRAGLGLDVSRFKPAQAVNEPSMSTSNFPFEPFESYFLVHEYLIKT